MCVPLFILFLFDYIHVETGDSMNIESCVFFEDYAEEPGTQNNLSILYVVVNVYICSYYVFMYFIMFP